MRGRQETDFHTEGTFAAARMVQGWEGSKALSPGCSHMQDGDCKLLAPGVISTQHMGLVGHSCF